MKIWGLLNVWITFTHTFILFWTCLGSNLSKQGKYLESTQFGTQKLSLWVSYWIINLTICSKNTDSFQNKTYHWLLEWVIELFTEPNCKTLIQSEIKQMTNCMIEWLNNLLKMQIHSVTNLLCVVQCCDSAVLH